MQLRRRGQDFILPNIKYELNFVSGFWLIINYVKYFLYSSCIHFRIKLSFIRIWWNHFYFYFVFVFWKLVVSVLVFIKRKEIIFVFIFVFVTKIGLPISTPNLNFGLAEKLLCHTEDLVRANVGFALISCSFQQWKWYKVGSFWYTVFLLIEAGSNDDSDYHRANGRAQRCADSTF